jgi:hypothetical protein
MTELETRLFNALKEIEDAKLAEESYRWEEIGSYPNVKIPDEVRTAWLADLKVITDRQCDARDNARLLIKEVQKKNDQKRRHDMKMKDGSTL